MEKIFEGLKVFFEKHLIPTVFSLVLATVIFLYTPADNWIINKITDKGYFLFCAGVIFLFVQFIVYCHRVLPDKIYVVKTSRQYNAKEEQESMERLWSFIDKLNEEDRKILYDLLATGNKIIERSGGWYATGSILSNENIVHCRMIYRDGVPINQYLIDEGFYKSLQYSYKKYGKICHFSD